MRGCIIFLFLYFSVAVASAAVLHGTITDDGGKPISAATIYIQELQLGTSVNEQAKFEIRVKPGTYTCIFQCLGFKTSQETVKIAEQDVLLNIRLETKVYELPPVIISKNNEDPAYRVMRYAIAMAPYYSHEVSSYKADVYLKGTAKVNKISAVVKALARKELKNSNIKEGETYLVESMNEITFTAPNKYNHKVISSNSTLPANIGDFNSMNYVNINVYSINIFARDAFSNYRFSHEGYTENGDLLISKIKVTPRKKNPGLMSGYVYIIENTWQVYSGNLNGDFPYGTFNAIMTTNQVQQGVRLPTSYSFHAMLKALGNEATFDYAGTVRYKEIKKDKTLTNPLQAMSNNSTKIAEANNIIAQKNIAKKTSKKDSLKLEKRRKDLEQLLEKGALSNRDMYKASKLLQQEVEDKNPPSLNLSNNYKTQVDSSAKKHDIAYWDSIRPIPLKHEEVISYRHSDSIRALEQTPPDSTKRRGSWIGRVLMGSTYYPQSTLRVYHSGLLDVTMLDFNPVDGWTYGQYASLRKMFVDSTILRVNGHAWWAFNRKAFMWRLGTSYTYLPERRADVFASAEMCSNDFNPYNEESLVNSVLALMLHKNYNRLYDNRNITIGNNIDLTNGLSLRTTLSYSDRKTLENNTNFSFFNRDADYAPNIPVNNYLTNNYELHKAFIATATLSYTPQYFYRMRGRQKQMAYSDYPTFTLTWREGIPNVLNSKSNFSFAQISISQNRNLGLMEEFSYKIEGAKFFRNTQVDFPDFYHFNLPGYVTYTSGNDNYEYSRYYQYSTPSWGVSGQVRYTTPFLALKFLPLLNKTYIRENIAAHVLYTPQNSVYTEFGYSMSEIFLLMKFGVFVGFEETNFKVVGINFSFAL